MHDRNVILLYGIMALFTTAELNKVKTFGDACTLAGVETASPFGQAMMHAIGVEADADIRVIANIRQPKWDKMADNMQVLVTTTTADPGGGPAHGG